MSELKRLPKGYLAKVKGTKCKLTNFLEKLNMGYSLPEQVNLIKSRFITSQDYQDSNGDRHISFDFENLSSEFVFNIKSHRWGLLRSCVVFIGNTEDYVDNYKW